MDKIQNCYRKTNPNLFLNSGFWDSLLNNGLLENGNFVFINPHFSNEKKDELCNILVPFLSQYRDHLFFLTSGTTSKSKWVAISKNSFLLSAQSVNAHLKVLNTKDRWICSLPLYHVGGLSIYARAYLSQSSVVHLSYWDSASFINEINKDHSTLTSLVPTQIYDLIKMNVKPPKSLRAVLVGGGALSEELYFKSRTLGWPIIPTYGMTEASSQIATAKIESLNSEDLIFPELKILSHLEIKTSEDERICVRGESLLTSYIFEDKVIDPKVDGWFYTEDYGEISSDHFLKIRGRKKDFIKVMGENVNIAYLREILENLGMKKEIYGSFTLTSFSHDRLGNEITLIYEENVNQQDIEDLFHLFNQQVLGFERIQRKQMVSKIHRTDLGKIVYS